MTKRTLTYLILLPLCLLSSCSKDEDDAPEQSMAVTYATVAGTWQLTQYDGTALPEQSYLYMVLDRKNHTVELYSNLDSGYTTHRQGTYTISGDDYYGYTLSGTYGVVAGDWQHSYHVALYPSGFMQWTATDDPSYQQIFTRVDAIPQYIIDESKWRE